MLGDEYIDRMLPSGRMLRVDMKRGSFAIVEQGERLEMDRKILPVNHVVFLGEGFSFDPQDIDVVRFFPVRLGKAEISFSLAESSDVRHYRLPVSVEIEMIPVMIFHFPAYWPGPLPALNMGTRVFVFDGNVSPASIVRLKGKFPKSRAYVFQEENLGRVRLEANLGANAPSNARAVDYVIDDDADFVSKDPVFAARVFLRRLEFSSMRSLPLMAMINQGEIDKIITFLSLMLGNAEDSIELSPHKKKLNEVHQLYSAIRSVLMFDMPVVKRWQKAQKGINTALLEELIAVTKAQKVFYEREGYEKKAEFLEAVCDLLSNRYYQK